MYRRLSGSGGLKVYKVIRGLDKRQNLDVDVDEIPIVFWLPLRFYSAIFVRRPVCCLFV